MSARARDWAYSVTLPLCQKFVLVALAERANDDGVAWPSARTISDMTGACDKAVRNALKQLEQGGFIVRVSSGTRSKTYQLSLNGGNEIPVSGTGQPVRHTGQPVRDTAVLDTGYPVPHTTQPVSGTGLTGTTYRQTVSNRQEPTHCSAPRDEDWVSANWMKIGNDVLAIAGHNPANAMAPTGIVRQWLADARSVGHSLATAREVILSVVQQRCDRGSGKGKASAIDSLRFLQSRGLTQASNDAATGEDVNYTALKRLIGQIDKNEVSVSTKGTDAVTPEQEKRLRMLYRDMLAEREMKAAGGSSGASKTFKASMKQREKEVRGGNAGGMLGALGGALGGHELGFLGGGALGGALNVGNNLLTHALANRRLTNMQKVDQEVINHLLPER